MITVNVQEEELGDNMLVSDELLAFRCGLDICVRLCTRRDVLKRRASKYSRSVCETFAFATPETVSVASANSILSTFGNVRINTYL